MLRPLMHYFERRLHARDDGARVSHPFEWGLEFLDAAYDSTHGPHNARQFIKEFNEETLARSDDFYAPAPSRQSDFESSASESGFHLLKFPSAVITPYEKNNLAYARFFPAAKGDCAVIVSPQWNAKEDSHVALCRGLNRLGVSALRLSLPFHDQRTLDGFTHDPIRQASRSRHPPRGRLAILSGLQARGSDRDEHRLLCVVARLHSRRAAGSGRL
jgi:hypothetical protein